MKNNSNLGKSRRTRIIATLGPATNNSDTITRLLETGVNIFRLNMSHGSHQDHEQSVSLVRRIARRLGLTVAIFCDLCGPKIRVGLLKNGQMELRARAEVAITTRRVERQEGLIPCQYPSLHKDVQIGDRILLDDGNIELKVLDINGRDIRCRVVYGGTLTDKKGINLPGSQISSDSLTAADRDDVRFALKMRVDLIALSFVRTAEDVRKLRRFMKRQGDELPVIAKIEKPEALHNIDQIIDVSYAIMIARGDLGIEIDAAEVPMVQRDLIFRARQACKPVIVATQMMESMIGTSRPTRAEVSDVSNAAWNGADAVMLSGETSVGRYPVQAVRYMAHILQQQEQWQAGQANEADPIAGQFAGSPRRALAQAAVKLALDLNPLGLFIPTATGATVGVVAALRPEHPVFGICTDEHTARLLMLHWGVIPVVMQAHETSKWDKMVKLLGKRLKIGLKGQTVLILAGFGQRSDNNQPVLKLLNL
jgi:pyruvate kinase